MAAALVAGAHSRVLFAELPDFRFFTYVDDRTLSSSCCQQMIQAVNLLGELDRLSGQQEDAAKEELAGFALSDEFQENFPQTNHEFLDLLGIRFHFDGTSTALSPKAAARWSELQLRLQRLRKLAKGLRLSSHQLFQVVKAEMGLLAWDAAWLISDPPGLRKMTTLVELTLQGRHRHAAWRHRGASWLLLPRGWMVEPHAVIWWCLFFVAHRLRHSPWYDLMIQCWHSGCGLMGRLAFRLKNAYEALGWQPTDSPFVFRLPAGLCDIGMLSAASLGHAIRQGWRAHQMQFLARLRTRHVSVDISSVDLVPLHKFLHMHRDDNPALAWRCAVAAEPNLERLAHVADVDKHCPHCPGHPVGTTHHIMWDCCKTAPLRPQFRVEASSLGAWKLMEEMHGCRMPGMRLLRCLPLLIGLPILCGVGFLSCSRFYAVCLLTRSRLSISLLLMVALWNRVIRIAALLLGQWLGFLLVLFRPLVVLLEMLRQQSTLLS